MESRFGVDDTKVDRFTKILGNLLEKNVMRVVRASGELAECNNRITQVGTTTNVSIKQFTEQSSEGEAVLGSELGMFLSALHRTSKLVHGFVGFRSKGNRTMGTMGRGL